MPSDTSHNIDLINDVFTSVYRKDYIFFRNYDRAQKADWQVDVFKITDEQLEKYLKVELKADLARLAVYKQRDKELNLKRLKTIYRQDYTGAKAYSQLIKQSPAEFSPENDSLIQHGSKLFGSQIAKVLPPVPSSRRINGYSHVDWYKTPLSEYQNHHDRLGYERLKSDADRGHWRMGPRYDHEAELENVKKIIYRIDSVVKSENSVDRVVVDRKENIEM